MRIKARVVRERRKSDGESMADVRLLWCRIKGKLSHPPAFGTHRADGGSVFEAAKGYGHERTYQCNMYILFKILNLNSTACLICCRYFNGALGVLWYLHSPSGTYNQLTCLRREQDAAHSFLP
jgi:hypothetical protein